MCYNINASVNASVVGFISSYILYNNSFTTSNSESRVVFQQLAIFFAFVTLMQVYDAVFWNSLKDKRGINNTNYLFTKIAMITNHLQPLVLAYLVNKVVKLDDITILVIYIYSFIASIYSIQAYNRIDYTLVTKESAPALHWKWNTLENGVIIKPEIMYGVFLTTLSIISLQLPYPISVLMLFVNVFTFGFSRYTYKNTEIGRMWCFIAAYVPVLLLFFEMLFK
jgi:hypothetical protein